MSKVIQMDQLDLWLAILNYVLMLVKNFIHDCFSCTGDKILLSHFKNLKLSFWKYPLPKLLEQCILLWEVPTNSSTIADVSCYFA